MKSSVEDLERMWERLAEALDEAGPEKQTLLLAKLALIFAHEIGDAARVDELIVNALRDLE